MMHHISVISLFLSISLTLTSASLVNVAVDRNIDISTHLTKITSQVNVQNKGTSNIGEYSVQFGDPDHDDGLSYLLVTTGNGANKETLKLLRTDKGPEFSSYIFAFPSPLGSGKSIKLDIEAVFTHLLDPYPEVISQSETQLVVYEDRLYYPSPYETLRQTTKVLLQSASGLESYTKTKASFSGKTITYGPFESVPPTENAPTKENEELRIHCENSSPFLTVTNLDRSVQVSHWTGNVQVTETIDAANTGAKLDGVFSRFDYQRDPSGSVSAIKNWRTKLPAGAQHIVYRDEIGNISTSNVRPMFNQVGVDIRPRFPLFGGWKTQYFLGYIIPATKVFFSDPTSKGEYVLKVPLVDHIFDNMVIDHATVKIILPEFSSDFRLELPYNVARQKDEIYYSYFDSVGRPVLVFKIDNLVEWHIKDVIVRYHFNPVHMAHEPLLIMGSIFSLCLFVIVLVRTRTNLDGK